MADERRSLGERVRLEIIFRVLWLISSVLLATVRVRTVGGEKLEEVVKDGKGGLVLPWHGWSLLAIYHYRKRGFYSMVSVSKDGELQNKVLVSRGFRTIRGSSGRRGVQALLESVRCIQEGNVMAITPDGPKGPARKVQPGPVYLARKSQCPVLPVGVACEPCWRLSSWDSHAVPKPFSRAVILFGDPLRVGADDGEEEAAMRIAAAIDAAEDSAREALNAWIGKTA